MEDFDTWKGRLPGPPFKLEDEHLTGKLGKSLRLVVSLLEASQLSDGERGVLLLSLDLTLLARKPIRTSWIQRDTRTLWALIGRT